MTELQVGEYVDIAIKGARIYEVDALTGVHRAETENGAIISWLAADTRVEVVRVAPAEWPPRPGDLWRDRDGALWAWRRYTYHDGEYRIDSEDFISLDGKRCQWGDQADDVLRDFGPLQLVRREQANPEPEGSWPPKAGEVWKDRDGDEWTVSAEPGGLSMCDDGGNSLSPDYVRANFGPLTLTRRQQGEAKR